MYKLEAVTSATHAPLLGHLCSPRGHTANSWVILSQRVAPRRLRAGRHSIVELLHVLLGAHDAVRAFPGLILVDCVGVAHGIKAHAPRCPHHGASASLHRGW